MLKKGLDLMLVNAGGSRKRAYQDLSVTLSAIEPPFWAALTAGFLRNKGQNAEILDANANNLTHEETADYIEECKPRLVNVVVYGQHPSASTQLMDEVGELCRQIKRKNPGRKIILTGLHPSALPKRTLEEEECDYVCQGEGFQTLQGLLEGGEPRIIPGLWWRDEKNIVGNPRAQNIQNLTQDLSEVAWNLLSLKEGKYRAHNWQCLNDFSKRKNYASLSTSLGCPFQCTFCSIWQTFGERRIRYWDPKWAVDQISDLAENHGVEVIKIIDELFVLKPQHYLAIADGIIERGLGDRLNIWAYARVDTANPKHLEKLRKAGFKWLCFGFESGNEEILKEMHKGNFTRQDMVEINKRIRESGINVLGNYMFGFPKDTQKTMQETLDLALEQNCEFANFYCATAWPGSQLYQEVVDKGLALPERWSDFAQHAHGFVPLPADYLSAKEVLAFRDRAFNIYFTNPQYLKMIEDTFGLNARKHIENMTQHKLKRKLLDGKIT